MIEKAPTPIKARGFFCGWEREDRQGGAIGNNRVKSIGIIGQIGLIGPIGLIRLIGLIGPIRPPIRQLNLMPKNRKRCDFGSHLFRLY